MSLFCHLLIGVPASGKSTFAEHLATLTNAEIISTDAIRTTLYGDASIQGDWDEISAEISKQIEAAISQGTPIIYDATNAKRAWRLEFLRKWENEDIKWIAWYLQTPLEICKERNQKRDRHVPESIIEHLYQSLKDFPPVVAEGFAMVNILKTQEYDTSSIQKHIDSLALRQIYRTNRTQHPNVTFHPYSKLLDFDRLLHLLSLLIQYPGLGNLNPTQIMEIFGENRQWDDSLEEIAAVMEKLRGKVYANQEAIAEDLSYLQQWGIISQKTLTLPQQQEIVIETRQPEGIIAHAYSEIEPFKRLLTTIRLILNNPFLSKTEGEKSLGYLETLTLYLQQQIDIQGDYYDCLRKDIERILKPYQILPPYPMKHGYFAGTGILSAQELKSVFMILQSQAKSLEDPITLKSYELLKERMFLSKLEQDEVYPVRAIANRSMIDLDYLHESILLHQLDYLEQAIEQGELVELNRKAESGTFSGDIKGFSRVWPLQIIFYNFAWYLGYECADSLNLGLFRLERLDRLYRGQSLSQCRDKVKQWRSLDKLHKLLKGSAGIFLGNSLEEQHQYLNWNKKGMSEVETLIELQFTDPIFRFIAEGTKRFSPNKIKMSPPLAKTQHITGKALYSLSRTSDKQFPNRFQVIIPKWSLEDVDFIRWIVGFGGDVRVIQPDVLKKRVCQLGKDIYNLYRSEDLED